MSGYLGNSLSAFCGSGPPEDHDLLREARLVVHQEADVLRQTAQPRLARQIDNIV